MNFFTNMIDFLNQTIGGSVWVLIPFISFILVVGGWRLFTKAGQSGIQSIVPFWNVVGFMKIIGRPSWHSLFIIVPILAMGITVMADSSALTNLLSGGVDASGISSSAIVLAVSAFALIVSLARVSIDLCNSFGRRSVVDYVMSIGLNILYVLYLGLDYDIEYTGPSYGVDAETQESRAYA